MRVSPRCVSLPWLWYYRRMLLCLTQAPVLTFFTDWWRLPTFRSFLSPLPISLSSTLSAKDQWSSRNWCQEGGAWAGWQCAHPSGLSLAFHCLKLQLPTSITAHPRDLTGSTACLSGCNYPSLSPSTMTASFKILFIKTNLHSSLSRRATSSSWLDLTLSSLLPLYLTQRSFPPLSSNLMLSIFFFLDLQIYF